MADYADGGREEFGYMEVPPPSRLNCDITTMQHSFTNFGPNVRCSVQCCAGCTVMTVLCPYSAVPTVLGRLYCVQCSAVPTVLGRLYRAVSSVVLCPLYWADCTVAMCATTVLECTVAMCATRLYSSDVCN